MSDVRYAIRTLGRSPWLTAAAVLSLALGIGANAAIFSWFKAVLLNPFPGAADTASLQVLSGLNRNGDSISVSWPTYRDIRDQVPGLAGVLVQDLTIVHAELGAESAETPRVERLHGALVSANYFDVLGVRPMLGRALGATDDVAPGQAPVLVISHRLWQVRFASDANIIGRTVRVNTRPFTIVGVAPAAFRGTFRGIGSDFWAPMMMQPQLEPGEDRLTNRGNRWLQSIARLAPGVTIAQAQAALDARTAQIARENNAHDTGDRLVLLAPIDAPWGIGYVLKPALIVLMGVVSCVLLITCANIANLLLARALGRRRELAVRLSLGASRGRLVRQMLTESLVLAMMGGLGGLLVGAWTSHLLLRFMPAIDMPLYIPVGMDPAVAAFTAAITLGTSVLFGLAPAWRASNPHLIDGLRDEAANVAGGGNRLRSVLVVGQVALSLILLTVATLFLRSLQQGQWMDPGFQTDRLLLGNFSLFPSGYTPEQGRRIYEQLRERLEESPRIAAASVARRRALGFSGASTTSVEIEGYAPGKDEQLGVRYNTIAPAYFDTMGIAVLRGREFSVNDRADSLKVAIVNDAMARRYWGERDPVGRRMALNGHWRTIVGVVATNTYSQLNEPPRPFLFLPVAQDYRPDVVLHVRTTGDPAAAVADVRAIFADVAKGVPLYEVQTGREHLHAALALHRMAATFLGAFGLLALLLASVGLYGVMTYIVSQRTREVGIRLALGATPRSVRRQVVREALTLAAGGLAIGVSAAWLLAGLLRSQLTGIQPHDALTFTLVPAMLVLVSFVSSYLPARRASAIDPITALKRS